MTSIQKSILQKWNNNSRYAYNKSVWLMNNDSSLDELELRNLITPKKCCSRIPWFLETPKEIREAAVFESHKNKDSAFTNIKNKNIKHFKLKYKSSKKKSWIINGITGIKKINNKTIELYPRYHFGHIKTVEEIPDINNECSIYFDGLNYFINIIIESPIKKIKNRKHCIASDPGIRTFHTFYDTENIIKIGNETEKTLLPDLLITDKLKNKNKLKQKLKLKIENKRNELHNKTINWLCKTYDKIIIPKFETKNMIKKENRKLNKKTIRMMGLLSHFKFLKKLKTKAKEFKNEIIIGNEAYSTRTCGNCEFIKNDIGSLEEWICNRCKIHHDRDSNASRNIFIWNYK